MPWPLIFAPWPIRRTSPRRLVLRSVRIAAAAFFCTVWVTAQVLSPPEISDPDLRILQERHFPELKAGAVDITSQEYPYRFYLSRMLDVTEDREHRVDQRSIR